MAGFQVTAEVGAGLSNVEVVILTPWVFRAGVWVEAKRNIAVVEAIGYGKF
jgi:hypothetical protein